jgi:hypothetical protein
LKISNKIIGEDRFEGGHEIFMFIRRGHGLIKVEKHCCKGSIPHCEREVTKQVYVEACICSYCTNLSLFFCSSFFQIMGFKVILIVKFYGTGLALKLHIVRIWRDSGFCGLTFSVRDMTRQQPCGLSTFSGRGL